MKRLVVFMVGILVSCSLRDYMGQPVLQDVYDGPMVMLVSPMGGVRYSGEVRVIADIEEQQGLGDIEILYDGRTDRIPAGGVSSYHLDRKVRFSSAGVKTLELRAYNRVGIRRSVAVSVTIIGPTIVVTNDFARWGDVYTRDTTLTLGGVVSNGLTNIESVFVEVRRPSQGDTYPATLAGAAWSVTLPLTPNEDVDVVASVRDMSGLVASTSPLRVYQDSRGPTLGITRPTNGAREAIQVYLEGKTQDDKVGPSRLIWTTNGWSSSVTNDLESWWGNRERIVFTYDMAMTPGPKTLQVYAEDFLGNASLTNTVSFMVDPTFPYLLITGPEGWRCTNQADFPLYGVYGNATTLEYTLNNGPWTPVTTYGGGYWTNMGLPSIPNEENRIRFRMMNASNTNISSEYRFLVDTIPPEVALYDTGGSIIVNRSTVTRRLRLTDNLSGIRVLYDTLIGKWGPGGTGVLVESDTNEWLGNWYEDEGTKDFPLGAVLTNTLVIIDRAGNTNTLDKPLEVYPAIFVSRTLDETYGIANAPVKATSALSRARSLGVRTLVFEQGTHTLTAPLEPDSGMQLVGGFDSAFTTQDGYTFLQRAGGRVLDIHGVSNVFLWRMGVADSGGLAVDSVMVVSNASCLMLDSIISNNTGSFGTALLARNAQVGLVSNRFIGNTNRGLGIVLIAGSLSYGVGNIYTNNATYAPSNHDAQLMMVGSRGIVSNETFAGFHDVGGFSPLLMDVYARDMGSLLVETSRFAGSSTTLHVHLWMSGNMTQVAIRSNVFDGPAFSLMVKEGNWGGYQLRGNSIRTNTFTNLWMEIVGTVTNTIENTNIAALNTPTKTRATPDSTDNVNY